MKYIRLIPNNFLPFQTEVLFLKHHNHPNLVKLVGCCESDELLATIYDISPLDTLHNLLHKGSVLILFNYPILCHTYLFYYVS